MRPRHPSHDLPTLDASTAWSLVGEPVASVEPFGEGTRSRVYRVTLVDGGARVVRITPKASGRAAREAWVRARMTGVAALPIVASVAVRTGSLAARADVELMGEVPGVSFSEALREGPADVSERLWYAFGEGLAALHAVPIKGFGLLDGAGRGRWSSWREAAAHLADGALREARASELVDRCDAAEAALAALAPALDGVHDARLLHGDATPANVRVRGDRVVGWFDFEYAMGADPLYELAFVGRLFEEPGRYRWMEAFTRGYTERLALVVADPERLRYYRVVHALRAGEFLRVAASAMAPEGRAAAVAAARGRLDAALSRS